MENKTQKANTIYNIEIKNHPDNIKSKNDTISVNQGFLDCLEKVEFPGFRLSQLFTWPEFYFTTPIEEGENIKGNLEHFISRKNKYCFIKGTYLSGKSAVGKMIYIELAKGGVFSPIFIEGSYISKGNIDFDAIINKHFIEQYNGNYLDFKSNRNKVIIVDDYHSNINNKFIEYCDQNFAKVIYIVSNDDFLTYFNDDKKYVEFDAYTINLLNYEQQHNLIINWLKKDYSIDDDGIYNKNFDLIENRIEDVVGRNNLVPNYPFYILSIIQAFDNVMTRDYRLTSYGHCYYALIISQLEKKGIDKNDWTACINFLKFLSYHIFKIKGSNFDYISDIEYAKFKLEYSQKFTIMSNAAMNRLENENYSILRKKGQLFRFEHEYIYYYFIGKFIAEEDNNLDIIENLSQTLYRKSSSNILIFTIHHASNSKILDEIQLHCMTTFDSIKECLLINSETRFLDSLIDTLPQDITSNKAISTTRKEEQKKRDTENKKNELSDEEIENNDELLELSKAFKIIEVLGQILKNRSGNLEKIKLEELLHEIEKLGLRLMTFLLEFIKSENFYDSIEEMLYSVEKIKGKKIHTDHERKQIIEKFIQNTGMRIILGLIVKVFQSISIEQVKDLQRNITNKNQHPSYELFYALFELNYGKANYENIKKIYEKFQNEKNYVALKVMSFFIQSYMNSHYVDQNIRQSLYKMLGIRRYIPNKLISMKK